MGLSYPGVESAARMMGLTITPEMFAAVRVAEREWLDIIAANRK